ncbi:hypothetical protein [Pontibacter burrus]|uniref:STAS/SEC14 domain-containing protein n=1 Tax=Pontibacter burrus TaxID=2704466 RepID=A0A6B3LTR4_9BACT|nr:hypothetical protein [Pontibacter burrus]NEM97646.1 hypothetical protein [Pontibacter burrus]
MLLHKDGLIELNYEVANDILSMDWPDLTGFTMPEISYSIRKLIDTLRHYDIKYLLVNSQQSNVSELTRAEYQRVLMEFVQQLMNTRLQKLARISTFDISRENVVDGIAEVALIQLGIQFEFRNFQYMEAALDWLRDK